MTKNRESILDKLFWRDSLEELVQKSFQRLPTVVSTPCTIPLALPCTAADTDSFLYGEGYRQVSVTAFPEMRADCFALE